MQEYKTAEEYIVAVRGQIRWKRARAGATREIADHIEDAVEAQIQAGAKPSSALRAALLEMGDPEEVGRALDKVHRPKIDLPLLGAVLLTALLATALELRHQASGLRLAALGIGIAAGTALYFFDYTRLIRAPRLCYSLLTGMTAVCFLIEARNGLLLIGYSYTFYLLLSYPLALAGIACGLGRTPRESNLILFLLCLAAPVTVAVEIASLPAVILLLVTGGAILGFGLRRHWFPLTPYNLCLGGCTAAGVVVGLAWLGMFLPCRRMILPSVQELRRWWQMLSEDSALRSDACGEHPALTFATEYGGAALCFLGLALIALILLFFGVSRRQTAAPGALLAQTAALILLIQLLSTAAGDMGCCPTEGCACPFSAEEAR